MLDLTFVISLSFLLGKVVVEQLKQCVLPSEYKAFASEELQASQAMCLINLLLACKNLIVPCLYIDPWLRYTSNKQPHSYRLCILYLGSFYL